MTPRDVQAHADAAIARGSQSFAAASRLFGASMRNDVALLYAWCRHCDDAIDGQVLGHGRVALSATPAETLALIRAETRRALEGGSPDHPAYAGLAAVARRRFLPATLPFHHLDGFEMDVGNRRYDSFEDLLLYCYRVAGVVGIMMAHVMGARASATLDRACDLGIAFQLTNIARDVIEDAGNGRLYLPLDWLREAGVPADGLTDPGHRAAVAGVVARLVAAAEPYYASARDGLPDLPLRAAWAVDAARGIYRAIGMKVARRGGAAWDRRARTAAPEKLGWLMAGAAGALMSRRSSPAPRPSSLWIRPEFGWPEPGYD